MSLQLKLLSRYDPLDFYHTAIHSGMVRIFTISGVPEYHVHINRNIESWVWLQHFPDCALLRRHPAPPHSNFEPLLAAAASQVIYSTVLAFKCKGIVNFYSLGKII